MTVSRRLLLHLATFTVLLTGIGAIAFAQDPPRDIRLSHELSLADSLLGRVDFRLSLPYERLVFERDEEGFSAQVRVVLRGRRRSDGLEESLLFQDKVHSEHFAASREQNQRFEAEFGLPLPPGRWELTVQIYTRDARRPWRREFDLEMPDTSGGGFFLQGPRWVGGETTELTPTFRFHDPWRIPDERSRFADGLDARIGLETSLLGRGDTTTRLEYILTLENPMGELVHYDRRRFPQGNGQELQRWEIPLARLGMGAYLLTVTAIRDGQNHRVHGRLDLGLTAAAFDRDWSRSRELLRPLATPDEWRDLEGLPRELRLRHWRSFWERRTPGGDMSAGPSLADYCRRIDEANASFGASRLAGYLSDRGQVYLENGPPDRRERFEDESGFRTLEYWHYGAQGLIYIFEDRHGSGEFVLSKVSNS